MKPRREARAAAVLALLMALALGGCGGAQPAAGASQAAPAPVPAQNAAPPASSRPGAAESGPVAVTLTAGGKSFAARLEDNASTRALLKLMPMTLKMEGLNSSEKFCYLASSLPASDQGVGTIHEGDLMLYGGNCVVVFYKTFDTKYGYTRLGRIADTSGLAEALGGGEVEVTFTAD